MTKFNKCRLTAAGNIQTPRVKLSYPFLFKTNPQTKNKTDGSEKYTLSLLIPPDVDISLLKKAAEDAAIEEFGAEKFKSLIELGKFNIPFLDAYAKSKTEKNPGGNEDLKGWTMIRAASKQRPGIVNYKAENVDDESEVYPGRWALVSLKANAYPPIDGGKSGVNFWLQNVQLLDHDTPLAGSSVRAEDEFAPVEIDGGSESAGGASADSVFG